MGLLLSACMIVKNEASTLSRCLDSLTGVADEVIVLDTGSTDDTVSIAQEYTSLVFHYDWEDDFAKARNESLKYAQGDFILVIDGDEYLDSNEKGELRGFLTSTDADCFTIRIRNYTGTISRPVVNPDVHVPRIFRRGYRYSGRLHEEILPSILDNDGKIQMFPLTIHHVGYLDEVISVRGKIERNLPLAEAAWKDDPDNIYTWTNLMAEYLRQGDLSKCVNLGKGVLAALRQNTANSRQIHLYARGLSLYIAALLALGERTTAVSVSREGVRFFPENVELQKQHADSLMSLEQMGDAVEVLTTCRELGEPDTSWVDSVRGLGSFLAAQSLGDAWSRLGDEALARKWYLRAFMENHSLATVVGPLLHLLPRDPQFLMEHVESKIGDWLTYANYAESYICLELDEGRQLLERLESKYEPAIAERGYIGLAARNSHTELYQTAKHYNTPSARRLLVVHELDNGDVGAARKIATEAQGFADDVMGVYDGLVRDPNYTFRIGSMIRDLILMRAERLLTLWLPKAVDRNEVYLTVRHSPMRGTLEAIEWGGNFGWECELNAMRQFAAQDWTKATEWLERGMKFPPTIRKVLTEIDLALAHENVPHAYQVLKVALQMFPESETLEYVKTQLGFNFRQEIAVSDMQLQGQGDEGMNPMEVYRRTTVQTMPFHIQLAQLHERGALLTQLVRELAQAGNINEMRKNIEELQNIVTFLRGSLNVGLDVAQVADQTYAYVYKTLVRWFLQPTIDNEEYNSVLTFWESWADTWRKVTN